MARTLSILPFVLLVACGDSHTADDGGGGHDGGPLPDGAIADGGGTDGGACTLPVAEQHRASASACPMDRPMTTPDPTAMGDCATDADCTEGVNGRCVSHRGYAFCSYDTCFADDACEGPCLCRGEGGGVGSGGANRCVSGNCQTDADCGPGNFCSPTLGDCGLYGGTVGYYCHTCDDECTNDSECTEMGAGYCAYSPTVAHWICQYTQCAG